MKKSHDKDLKRIKSTVEENTASEIADRMLKNKRRVSWRSFAELVVCKHLSGVMLPEKSINVGGVRILVIDDDCRKKIDEVCDLLREKDILQNPAMYGLFEKYREVEIFRDDHTEFITKKRAIFKDTKSAYKFWEAYKKVYAVVFKGIKMPVKIRIVKTETMKVFEIK
jgi:hypothetical protein